MNTDCRPMYDIRCARKELHGPAARFCHQCPGYATYWNPRGNHLIDTLQIWNVQMGGLSCVQLTCRVCRFFWDRFIAAIKQFLNRHCQSESFGETFLYRAVF